MNFRIPWDAQPTETRSPGNAIVWQLEALADVPGVDYHDVFEVPVFRTQQTPAQPKLGDELVIAPARASRPAVLTIEVGQTANGTEFFFPAARNQAFAYMTTAFLVAFGLITYFLVHLHAPFIFPLGFGFFTFLLLYITMEMWLGTTRVIIGNGVLSVQDGLLGGGKVKQFRLGEIATISSKINAQQGGGTGTPYYDIEVVLRNGRKRTLGRTLRDKQETDWLVDEMRRQLGLQDKAMTAGAS